MYISLKTDSCPHKKMFSTEMQSKTGAKARRADRNILANAVGGWHNIELTMKVHKGGHSRHATPSHSISGGWVPFVLPIGLSGEQIMEFMDVFC